MSAAKRPLIPLAGKPRQQLGVRGTGGAPLRKQPMNVPQSGPKLCACHDNFLLSIVAPIPFSANPTAPIKEFCRHEENRRDP